MLALFIVLGVVATASIVAALVNVARDGYRRAPERNLVRIF